MKKTLDNTIKEVLNHFAFMHDNLYVNHPEQVTDQLYGYIMGVYAGLHNILSDYYSELLDDALSDIWKRYMNYTRGKETWDKVISACYVF